MIYIFAIKEEASFKPRKVYLNKGSNVHVNIVALSANPYCCGCKSFALVIHYRKAMRSIILSHVAFLAVIFFHSIS